MSNSHFFETPYSQRNDKLLVPCWCPKCTLLLMESCYLGRMAISRESNYHFGKRSITWEMTTFGSHVGAQSVNSYWWNFAISGPSPSPGVIFDLLLLPCGWEIETWADHLQRSDFLGICWFSNIYNRSRGPGRYPICSGVKFSVECTQNHVWGPLVAGVMSIFVKTYILV